MVSGGFLYSLANALDKYQIWTESDDFGEMYAMFLISIVLLIGFVSLLEKRFQDSKNELKKNREHLEELVRERTAKLEKNERRYREAYNLVNFYKDLFAHDMNNILHSIISSVDFYLLFKDDPEKLKVLGDIEEVAKNHAVRGSILISNVMKLSQLDETEYKLSTIEIFDVLNKAVENTVNGFQERNVNIEIVSLSKDLKVLGNELLIDIFDNILNNAVKYTDIENEVKIDIRISKTQEEKVKYLKFEFIDRGIGVSDEKKNVLFKKEYARDISKKGMGIGMSLVKKIVSKYDGKIWVEDRIKGDYTQGSNFIILLKEG